MSAEMQKLIGASENDEEEDMEDVKEDDDDEEEDVEKRMSETAIVGVDGIIGPNHASDYSRIRHKLQMEEQVGTPGSGGRRCRPLEEKERTKLRERNRRAITARILAGLRRHGNYNLRVRADINDVIAALAREAGWVVLPDGTTFLSRSQVPICDTLTYTTQVAITFKCASGFFFNIFTLLLMLLEGT